jgi:hypothetical protein
MQRQAQPELQGITSQGLLQVNTVRTQIVDEFLPAPCPQAADLNGDKRPDLIVADPSGFFWFYPNATTTTQSDPKFGPGEILPIWLNDPEKWKKHRAPLDLSYFPRCHLTDFNDDNIPDLVVGSFFGELFFVPLEQNSGRIRAVTGNPPWNREIPTLSATSKGGPYWCNLMAPVYVDWDGDGLKELILGEGTFAANHIWIIRNQGSNRAPVFNADFRKMLINGHGQERLIPSIVDWNQDGKPDLAVASASGRLSIYLNAPLQTQEPLLGDAPPINISIASTTTIGSNACPSFADLNGDGLPDLLYGTSSGRIWWAKNVSKNGEPSFGASSQLTTVTLPEKIFRPLHWELTSNPLLPFASLQWISDNANASSPKPGCLYFSYYEPEHPSVEGNFPNLSGPDLANKFRYDQSSAPALLLENGKDYTLSFSVMGKGFSDAKWSLEGSHEIARKDGTKTNRRGKIKTNQATSSFSDTFTFSDSWRKISKTIKVKQPDLDPKTKIHHKFEITMKGTGEFYLDDLTLIEVKTP